jgi:hypothetical protein
MQGAVLERISRLEEQLDSQRIELTIQSEKISRLLTLLETDSSKSNPNHRNPTPNPAPIYPNRPPLVHAPISHRPQNSIAQAPSHSTPSIPINGKSKRRRAVKATQTFVKTLPKLFGSEPFDDSLSRKRPRKVYFKL